METLFRRLTLTLCDGAPLEDALCAALHLLRAALPAARLGLLSSAGDGGDTRLIAESDEANGRLLDLALSPAEGRAWAMQVTADEASIIERPDAHPLLQTLSKRVSAFGGEALLSPLGLGHRAVGALILWGGVSTSYHSTHAKLARGIQEPFAIALEQWLQRARLLQQQEHLLEDRRAAERALWGDPEQPIIGERLGLRGVMEQVRRIASANGPALLSGEIGVGKEFFARVLHQRSPKASGPLIKLGCALPEEALERALFGDPSHRGAIERAEGGTLFLEDLDALSLTAQQRVLRLLQSGEVARGEGLYRAEVRVIAATRRDLRKMVAAGSFREDLWFRLHTAYLVLPPLRERLEDLPALVEALVRKKAAELYREPPTLSPEALPRLRAYAWPGNLRELEVLIERAMFLYETGPLHLEPTPKTVEITPKEKPPPPKAPSPSNTNLDEAMTAHIRAVLTSTGGKIHGPGGAAELLGIKATTLRNRMDKLKIPYLKNKVQLPYLVS